MTDTSTLGIHHVGLAVPDLDAARTFFVEALDWNVVGEVPAYPAVFVSNGHALLTLWRVADPERATPFDRKVNVGLHHLAIAVADHAALTALFEKVRAHAGVKIEFEPGPMGPGASAHHFICAIPGGIRVEFATPLS